MSAQTWTYSGDPSASSLDKIRFLIGDTDPDDRQLADEEILFCVSDRPSIYSAAAMACRTLAAKYARSVTKQVGDLKIDATVRQQHYNDLADEYDAKSGEGGLSIYALSAPYAGGISVADRDAQSADSDRVDPAFEIGSMDYPGTQRGAQMSTST